MASHGRACQRAERGGRGGGEVDVAGGARGAVGGGRAVEGRLGPGCFVLSPSS
jgi:hypothetical protein